MIFYWLALLGGPYDGARGLTWVSPAKDPDVTPPDEIYVGRCPGAHACGGELCARGGHVAYWVDRELTDVELLDYRKVSDEEVADLESGRVLYGKAVYVRAGVSVEPVNEATARTGVLA